MTNKLKTLIGAIAIILLAGPAFAQSAAVMYLTTDAGLGEEIGIVSFNDTADGLKLEYDLKNLKPGEHGFHVHEHPNCAPKLENGHIAHAIAAGGHFDPEGTGKHMGPDGDGHRGDLPKLVVAEDGTAKGSITFGKNKKLLAKEFRDRSLMIHEGGDNYSDIPTPLGGGGARVGCGIIK